ncbi:MAG: SRPBCC domain-containing protein [Bacteroidetes bacterium]|nr:SRPBCC domain-containing protein [Bacteroidota bacterium]
MNFTIKTKIKATSREIYEAWLDSKCHTEMTGGMACISSKVGEIFTAWDDYIIGKNILLVPYSRIKQNWRTSQFSHTDKDSTLELILVEDDGETELTLIHTNLPADGDHYKEGWEKHYFKPMKTYFINK